jgi:Glycosyltransferase Family 4
VRIALLDHGRRGPAGELDRALAAAGHDSRLIGPRSLPDAPLRLRKVGDRPGRMPGAYVALRGGRWDVAHAFTAQDAAVAACWSRTSGRPAVFTCTEPLRRATLADRRLRLALLRRAVEGSAAVVAPDPDVAASLRRWMAVEARVIEHGSAAEYLALYRELLAHAAAGAR